MLNTFRSTIMDNEKNSFLKKMSEQLLVWDFQVDELKKKAEKAKGAAREEYEKQIKELATQKEALSIKFRELNKSGDEAWEILKNGIEKAATDLKSTFKNAFSKF
jgi:hypothetical protein